MSPGLHWTLGTISFLKGLEQAAQGSNGVTTTGGISNLNRHGAEGHGLVDTCQCWVTDGAALKGLFQPKFFSDSVVTEQLRCKMGSGPGQELSTLLSCAPVLVLLMTHGGTTVIITSSGTSHQNQRQLRGTPQMCFPSMHRNTRNKQEMRYTPTMVL